MPWPTLTVTIEQALDANHNCRIDNDEIIAVVGYWTNGTAVPGTVPAQTIDNQEIMKLAALWTTGNNICVAASASADRAALVLPTVGRSKVQTLVVKSIKAQALSEHRIRFVVNGSGLGGLRVQIYDLAGKAVFSQETNGTTLTFQGLDAYGQPLANGVYLYVVTVRGATGQTLTSEAKKLVLLR